MSYYDHVLKVPVLGDYRIGKTALLTSIRQRYRADLRYRRQSDTLKPFVPAEIEMFRKNKRLLVKLVDTGGMYFKYKTVILYYTVRIFNNLLLIVCILLYSHDNLLYCVFMYSL